MFWDIFIAVGLLSVAIAMAYLGVRVSLHPPNATNKKGKNAYKIWFIALGLIAGVLTIAQVVRNGIAQHKLLDAIAHSKPNNITFQHGSVAQTKQSFVDNQGTIGQLNQTGNSFSGDAPTGRNTDIIKTGGKDGLLTFTDTNVCNLSLWTCVLNAVEEHSGNRDSIETDVRFLQLHVKDELSTILNASPNEAQKCRQQIEHVSRIIIDNAANESKILPELRATPPTCLKSQLIFGYFSAGVCGWSIHAFC